ncbi:MAG: GNAT family N-acetyltransferase [Gammaproteobacteria bacterium]
MIAKAISRIASALADYGLLNSALYGLQRALQRLAPETVVERLYIVAQPVPAAATGSPRRGQNIQVRRITTGDPAIRIFTRYPDEIADRFAQGAVCLGAFRGDELLGWLWFVPGVFRDFVHPVSFALRPASTLAWDFDVYVRPDARLSAAFARLWEAGFAELRARGIAQSLSAISAYNPASLRAHRRLGTEPFGSILVLRLGRIRAVLSLAFRPHLQWSLNTDFRAVLPIDAPPRPDRVAGYVGSSPRA